VHHLNRVSEARAIQRKLHQTIKRVSDDFQGRWHFTPASRPHGTDERDLWRRGGARRRRNPRLVDRGRARNIALLLAPMAPYLAHELWEVTGEKSNLLKAAWPKYDPALAAEDEIEIPVQVNGSCAAWWWCRRVH